MPKRPKFIIQLDEAPREFTISDANPHNFIDEDWYPFIWWTCSERLITSFTRRSKSLHPWRIGPCPLGPFLPSPRPDERASGRVGSKRKIRLHLDPAQYYTDIRVRVITGCLSQLVIFRRSNLFWFLFWITFFGRIGWSWVLRVIQLAGSTKARGE